MDRYEDAIKRSCQEVILDNNVIATDESSDVVYNLRIRASRKTVDDNNYLYWCVYCEEPYGNSFDDQFEHPFRNLQSEDNNLLYRWGIVAENKLTLMLLEYISLSNEKLEKETGGNTCANGMRARYIKMLDSLWD